MRDRYEPPPDAVQWTALPPARQVRGTDDRYAGPDWDPHYPAEFDDPAYEARSQGLRRLSMLTVHASGLSVVAAISFTAVFAATAHAQTGMATPAKPTQGPAAAPGTPSPGPTHKHHKKRYHHHRRAAPAAAPEAPAADPQAPAAAPAQASSPTLAPPPAPPAPAPPSSPPPQITSSGSVTG
jgi:hypothetical protein